MMLRQQHPSITFGAHMQARTVVRSAIASAALVFCTATHAQSFRAYLSSAGSDANPCTVAQPCRLLPVALNAIVDGGEIWMLDSANYNSGTVAITKSATIMAIPGAIGSVSALGGPAMTVGTVGVNLVLRNLVFVPFPNGGGTYGLNVTAASRVTVEKSVFSNLPAINVNAAAYVNVSDTDFRYAGIALVAAIELNGGATANISNIRCQGFTNYCISLPGTTASTTTTATVSDSVMASGWGGVGLFSTAANAFNRAAVTRSTISGMSYGVAANCGVGICTVTVSGSQIHANSTGVLAANGAVVESAQNNSIRQNALNVSGVLTNVGQQ
jgi:hypothetical protein